MGDRLKEYEAVESNRKLMPLLPVCIRLDGRRFSKWTKGLKRPFDEDMHTIMVELTSILINETNACIGYTQSDEISLILHQENIHSQVYFGGRIQKIVSSLAGLASTMFNVLADMYLPEHQAGLATFDCRVWNVPNKQEAVNTILWREFDAAKNSVQQAARCFYIHKELLGKNSKEMQELLFQKGVNWNDYPTWYKRGTYLQTKAFEAITKFTEEEIKELPEKHPAKHAGKLVVVHNCIEEIDMPPLAKVVNRVDVIFKGEKPETEDNGTTMEED